MTLIRLKIEFELTFVKIKVMLLSGWTWLIEMTSVPLNFLIGLVVPIQQYHLCFPFLFLPVSGSGIFSASCAFSSLS